MNNIKVHVPTEEISRLVQEKLFEQGCNWWIYEKTVQHTTSPYLYVTCDDKIYFGECQYSFEIDEGLQKVHYLQILANDYKGQLFRYNNETNGHLLYQDTEGFVHRLDGDRTYYFAQFSTDYKHYIENNLITLLDVNEQPIINEEKTMNENTMPKLEAGKHLVELEDGRYGLVLADNICVHVVSKEVGGGFKQTGWDIIREAAPTKIYEIHRQNDLWSLLPIKEGIYHTLVWSKDSSTTEREQLKSEYEGICEQINALHKKAAELKEKL